MPLHKGHIFVAETGCNMVDEMTILTCSTDDDPIEGTLRAQWVQECIPRAKTIHLHKNLPQEPADHPDFWMIWKDECKTAHPAPIDYVFGSDSGIWPGL